MRKAKNFPALATLSQEVGGIHGIHEGAQLKHAFTINFALSHKGISH